MEYVGDGCARDGESRVRWAFQSDPVLFISSEMTFDSLLAREIARRDVPVWQQMQAAKS